MARPPNDPINVREQTHRLILTVNSPWISQDRTAKCARPLCQPSSKFSFRCAATSFSILRTYFSSGFLLYCIQQYPCSTSKGQNCRKSLSWMLLYSVQECGIEGWHRLEANKGNKNTAIFTAIIAIGVAFWNDRIRVRIMIHKGVEAKKKFIIFRNTCRENGY